jgi:hypothetical protein
LAAWATLPQEHWPTATPDAAYTSSVLSSVKSRLDEWYPPPPAPTPTVAEPDPVPTGPLYADVYRFYWWDCHTASANTRFAAIGKTSDGPCGSVKLGFTGVPGPGTDFNYCGGPRNMTYDFVSKPDWEECWSVAPTDGWCCNDRENKATSCTWYNIDCDVTVLYRCTDRCTE